MNNLNQKSKILKNGNSTGFSYSYSYKTKTASSGVSTNSSTSTSSSPSSSSSRASIVAPPLKSQPIKKSTGPPRDISLNGTHLPALGTTQHDCGSLARVVMVRKKDQRVINNKNQTNPQCRVVTLETVQTYRGHKPDKTYITKETETVENCTDIHNMSCSSLQSDIQNLTISSPKSTPNKSLKSQSPSPVLRKSIFSKFELECLETHNEFRSRHGVPRLKLSKKLCRFAEEWAKMLAIRGNPAHRSNSPYGENIFCAWCSTSDLVVNGREPVDNWYSEISSHAFGKEPATLKTGHFTQVIWSDSRELGVAHAKNRSGQTFVVANYDPPGNFIGSFTSNVPPLGGFSKSPTKSENRSLVSSTTSSLDFGQQMLKYHNEFRRKHNAPELKLSEELNRCALEWAQTLARDDRFQHRPNCKYGENLYCLWSSDSNAQANPKEVCRSWYDEVKCYTFGTEPRGVSNVGHFTQLVWKTSLELGVGVAKTNKGKVLIVCNYNPRGNIIGEFAKNVIKPH